MLPDETRVQSFTEFARATEAHLRHALTAAFGPDAGRDAAADALAYGWEHWDRVGDMDNPAGYLYRVGCDRARRSRRRPRVVMLPPVQDREPWIEPKLPHELARLPERQRVVVGLLYGYEWSMGEVASLLGVSRGTVQNHAERGLRRLRHSLGVQL